MAALAAGGGVVYTTNKTNENITNKGDKCAGKLFFRTLPLGRHTFDKVCII